MPPVLQIDPTLGRKIRKAREARGWSKPTFIAMLGPVGTPPKGLAERQLDRIEAGRGNLTPDAAWRIAELFPEYDPWEVLVAARAVHPDSSTEYVEATRREVERRREQWAADFRRYALMDGSGNTSRYLESALALAS